MTMGMTRRARLRWWHWLLGALAVLLAVLVLLWDWNWFKGPVERLVEAKTHRAFHIDGDLHVALGSPVTVRADGLRLADAAWNPRKDDPDMARVARLEVQAHPLRLLFGRDHAIPSVRVEQPRIYLQTGPQGQGNWQFDGGSGGGNLPMIDDLQVTQGQLAYVDRGKRTDVDLSVASAAAAGDFRSAPLRLAGKGHWAGSAFALSGQVGSPVSLAQAEKPYRIALQAQAGDTRAHVRGDLVDPLHLGTLDLKVRLAGNDLADLYPLLGIALPGSPPYAIDGRLWRQATTWHYDDFAGKVGDSDLEGNAAVTTGGKRLFFKGALTSRRLDFDDLAGFIGAAPGTGAGETANARQREQQARQDASGRLLPQTPYDLAKLRSMDADVTLKAHRINAPSLPLDDMDAHLLLQDGVLRLTPLNFGVASGDIRSEIVMDASADPIRTQARIAVRRLDLKQLVPTIKDADEAIGRVGGDIELTGHGNSIAQMLGSSDGQVGLGMGKGRISNLLLELAGLDIAESLKFLVTHDKQVPIRCAFADFGVRDGLMTSRALAFDTTDTIIIGSGTIDLKREALDLELRPRPKDRSILSLRTPLVVNGSFKDPGFHPKLGRLGLRGALAVALGSIAPPAALLATLELGPGKDSDCGGRYAK